MSFSDYTPRAPLFQFTSFDGFKGIAASKELWLSDIHTLNDPRELIYGLGLVRQVANNVLNENSDWNASSLRPILEVAFKGVRSTNLFACSFCESHDLMPLWQRYADDGRGVAIGFRPRALTDIPTRIQRIEYTDGEDKKAELAEAISKLLLPFASQKVAPTKEQGVVFSSQILALCTGTKHSSWSHEQETRLVYSQPIKHEKTSFMDGVTSLYPDGTEHKWQTPKTRTSSIGEVKYLPFKFGKFSNGINDYTKSIERVVVGPKATQSIEEISDILYSEGFAGFDVVKSGCVWR